MQIAVRPRLTAGVCMAGAGMIAFTALAPALPDVHMKALPAVSSAAVRLTADSNPFQAWTDTYNTAVAGATAIANASTGTPFPLLQQIIANQVTYLGEIVQNPSNFSTVLNQISTNVQAAVAASTLINASDDTVSSVTSNTLDSLHYALLTVIPYLLPAGSTTDTVTQVLNFLSSPLSGVLIGLAGPVLSPAVALANSVQSIVTALGQSDLATAAQDAFNIPASMVNGFLNGATLDISAVAAPLANASGLLPDGITLDGLTLSLGGLLTPGSTLSRTGVGGSIFNAAGLDLTLFGDPLSVAGSAVGPLTAISTLGQVLAKAIGWSGTGNPLASLVTSLASSTTQNSTSAVSASAAKTAATSVAATSIPQAAASQVAAQTTQAVQKLTTSTVATSTAATNPAATQQNADQPSATSAESSTASTEAASTGTAGGTDSNGSSTSTKKSEPKVSRIGQSSSSSTKPDSPKSTSSAVSSAKTGSAAKSNSTGSHSDNKGGSGK
ncbi:outer membrane porin GjpA [Mycobacterium sp. OTB74]|uniref:outer membrane porin GjpA n=1 Tax=Mycobacterium sp. OTB74 TaxID=1853452 RepID=UPI0024761F70|nr:outer membrane porin GjpA [Mycobacterium sp. OTB74]MDH6244963.1 hypothetical protein [Mycobacterium sp. OTB74]